MWHNLPWAVALCSDKRGMSLLHKIIERFKTVTGYEYLKGG